ncbi:hypothetical protein [Alcanivorax sediminis]|uniref:Uncharacterized protein n=1 Tax=Alcanivorax sediminis TaxID=2663008 RepID=A0A6N7LSU6_9GAMM|nr:hypothetical protein [Alcanivorax sediminis]MQX52254.1 hypothetical protein [Alcanivorax sediminis]
MSQVSSIRQPVEGSADVDAMRMRRNYVDGHLEAYQESGSSDYSPKTGETIAEICRSGQYNGG